VVNNELLTASEEFRQGQRSIGALESVRFVDFDVRELAAICSESFAGLGVFFFFLEEDLAGSDPFFTRSSLRNN
jgi:hypothetical protein